MAKRVSVDRWLFTVTMLLVFVGLVMVFSASAVMARERFGSEYAFLSKQLIWALAGLAAMVVTMRVDYRRYRHPALVFSVMGFTTLLLISVFFLIVRTTHIAGFTPAASRCSPPNWPSRY
jgi:cell division protein FtsW